MGPVEYFDAAVVGHSQRLLYYKGRILTYEDLPDVILFRYSCFRTMRRFDVRSPYRYKVYYFIAYWHGRVRRETDVMLEGITKPVEGLIEEV